MLLKMPTYCKDFRCIADRCKDNCCIGWEIDIDTPTAEYYESVKGDFGEKLKNNINKGKVRSFKLKGERCPFLKENNLCEIIINLGEDKLCQICSDHPRYFEWYENLKEGGIGLCCEEAARLIVTNREKFATYDTKCDDTGCDDYNKSLYSMLTFARNEIISALENENITFKQRINNVLSYAFEVQYAADNYDYRNIPIKDMYPAEKVEADIEGFLKSFCQLEPIDTVWENYLQSLIGNSSQIKNKLSYDTEEFEHYLKNIAVYFIWRYFLKGAYDEEILSKVYLMVVSTAMIRLMYLYENAEGADKCSTIAKNYSKEIEYSEENLEKIYDMVYDNPAFLKDNLLALL